MSTPPFVDLPPHTGAVQLPTAGGPLAGLRAVPPAGAVRRGAAVLVPGYTGSKEDFIAVLAPLAEAGYEVVAIDQRGQNESAGPDDPGAYTLARLAEDLADVVEGLGTERVHVLGHSFGGLVTREYALAHPGRVRSLALFDSGPAAVPGRSAEQAELLVAAAGFMSTQQIWAEMQKIAATQAAPQHPDAAVRAFLQRRFEANDLAMLIGMGTSILGAPDRTDELAAAGVPLLVAAGAGDDAWPVELQKDMATRLGTEFVLIQDAAHSPAAENPAATVRVLVEFWGQNG
ncbi:MAG: alpha/beta hydrolase [Catenulispora sp.]|nr:alpha/beta hydrolase [Catenulispora sp.]